MLNAILSDPSTMISFNEKGNMTFDGLDLIELADKYDTPFYVFSAKKLLIQYLKTKKTLNENFRTDVGISFPVRVNPTQAILKLLYENGSSFTASSIGELNVLSHILPLGEHSSLITYHSPILTKTEIKSVLKKGVKRFVIDNDTQLDRLNFIAEKYNTKIKVLIDIDTRIKPKNCTLEKNSGFDIYYAFSFFEKTKESPNLELLGIYNSLAEENKDIKSWIKNIRVLAEFILKLADSGIEIKELNLGSGIPMQFPEQLSADDIADAMSPYINELKKEFQDLEIIIEPGLSIAASSGVLLTKIKNIKDDDLYINSSVFNTILYSKITDLPKPIILPALNVDEPERVYNIRGNQNSPYDIFEKNIKLPPQKLNNLLVFFNAGAYQYSADYAQAKKIKTMLIRNK